MRPSATTDRRQFVFDRQIELLGITGLIVRVDADHAADWVVGARQVERRNRRESRRSRAA